jgi:Ca2+-binding EF-hand superfamily protein
MATGTINEVLDSVWSKYDFDQSGTLDRDESQQFYLDMVANRADLANADGYEAWFNKIDGDHDGTISREELGGFLTESNYNHLHNLAH